MGQFITFFILSLEMFLSIKHVQAQSCIEEKILEIKNKYSHPKLNKPNHPEFGATTYKAIKIGHLYKSENIYVALSADYVSTGGILPSYNSGSIVKTYIYGLDCDLKEILPEISVRSSNN